VRAHHAQAPVPRRAITPLPVGATADNVRSIDYQDLHSDRVSES
jgi:hypothetical protein